MDPTTTVTLLRAAREGDAAAADALLPHVYAELRRIAQARVSEEPGAVTVSATGLVHEAYLRLAAHGGWHDRAHFLSIAARAMRRILTDRARVRNADKRGGGQRALTLDEEITAEAVPEQVLALDEALDRLATHEPDLARLVEMRFFAGMTVEESAEALGVSPRTVGREWARAKALLHTLLA